MSGTYRTAAGEGKGEYTEKRSRFLGEIYPVRSEEEAMARVQAARKKYYDARHHCYAYILGQDGAFKKASDDGEPQGTAGQPILKVLEGAGCTDLVAVVTRYFGGTLLGTGGLVRAYTQAVREALRDAGIVRMCLCNVFAVTVSYSQLDRLLYFLRQKGLSPGETAYTDSVTTEITVEEAQSDTFVQEIASLTGGQAQCEILRQGFFPLPEESGR